MAANIQRRLDSNYKSPEINKLLQLLCEQEEDRYFLSVSSMKNNPSWTVWHKDGYSKRRNKKANMLQIFLADYFEHFNYHFGVQVQKDQTMKDGSLNKFGDLLSWDNVPTGTSLV